MSATPGLIRQKARRQARRDLTVPKGHQKAPPSNPPTDCRCLVSGSISLASPAFFSPFPHGTSYTIGCRDIFSLGGWSPQIPTGFLVPRGTREHNPGSPFPFAYGAFTLYGSPFQEDSARKGICNSLRSLWPPPVVPHNPTPTNTHRL